MTNIDSLLSSYQALSEEHAKQTEHQFVTIRQVLDERVKEIYDASDHLLEDQCVALNRIVDTLRTDAGCILFTEGFQKFLGKLDHRKYSWEMDYIDIIRTQPSNWMLATFKLSIGLMDYKVIECTNAYDDEKFYTGYEHVVSLEIEGEKSPLLINHTPYDDQYIEECSLAEIIQECEEWDFESILESITEKEEEIQQLGREIAILVVYSISLFTLKPTVSVFEYNSLIPEKYLSWFAPPKISDDC
ncbi:MAG: hypothetical protein ACL9RN_10110 [Cylindrospermopsis raciborskii]|jgi:hypothetical protein|uniref:hypothetical protein n=1 Tax=Cylindrospermopsis raciborskii TaxID=77022 RepID=UPI003D0C74C9